jgi:hypothetical protein
MVRLRACWAPAVILRVSFASVRRASSSLRVGLVEDDDFVSSGWKGDFTLSECLDLIPDHIDTTALSAEDVQRSLIS